ncbi:DUF4908 domain-containing protein [Hyphobacterium sp.]|uniref:DUF4908 domain-containing protein n=1 Tax=Hyphobacterium sp. TaxID=2004662 RepID=UPI003BA937FD
MITRRLFLAATLPAVVMGVPVLAAGADSPLRNRRNRREEVEPVAEFHRQDGRAGFVLDRSGDVWLLQPLNGGEVLALAPQRAPGGDTSFQTDWGQEIIRVSSIGAVTYYPEDQPNGVIAEEWEPARPIEIPDAGVDALRNRVTEAALELADLFGRPIQVEYGAAPRDGLGMMVETFDRLVEAMELALDEGANLQALNRVKVATADAPSMEFAADQFLVRINPLTGYAGRPSSIRMARALAAGSIPA